jgi:hypothetical protein
VLQLVSFAFSNDLVLSRRASQILSMARNSSRTELGSRPPSLAALALAHKERDKVRAAYNRAERLADRRSMMQQWADYLDGLRSRRD